LARTASLIFELLPAELATVWPCLAGIDSESQAAFQYGKGLKGRGGRVEEWSEKENKWVLLGQIESDRDLAISIGAALHTDAIFDADRLSLPGALDSRTPLLEFALAALPPQIQHKAKEGLDHRAILLLVLAGIICLDSESNAEEVARYFFHRSLLSSDGIERLRERLSRV
jgi:hypothetical protein